VNKENFKIVYEIDRYVSRGGFSKVFKGHSINSIQNVAIKMVRKGRLNEIQLEKQYAEIDILKVCNHPNIIKLMRLL